MAGTKLGGLRAAITNKQRHGADFYARIGRKGGQNGHTGGFYTNRELASIAGAKGGAKSRRTGVRNQDSQAQEDINAIIKDAAEEGG